MTITIGNLKGSEGLKQDNDYVDRNGEFSGDRMGRTWSLHDGEIIAKVYQEFC